MGTKLIEGKVNVYESFKKSYAAIIEMKQEPIRAIFSSNTGIFEIVIKWKFKAGTEKIIAIEMPLIVVLTVKEGKVIEHRDYGDYNYFLK
jgi:ketosteroid isomerase-like protein